MKILSYSERNNGCFWYREKIPFDALKRKGWNASHADKGDMVPNDVNMIQFARGYLHGFEDFVFQLKDKGVKIWYDIDDAMDLVKDFNPFAVPTKNNLGSYYFLLNEADFITTTSETIKEHLSKRTPKPIHVFPNFYNPDEWRVQRPKASSVLRIGFAGSASHVKDVNMVLPVIEELQKHHEFVFVIIGFDIGSKSLEEFVEKQKKSMGKHYDTHVYGIEVQKFYVMMKNIRHEWRDGVRWELHTRNLPKLDLDIGLCPLLDDDFNRCKTPIKFYEYALTGTPALCSKVTPFKEEALALTDNDFNSWYDSLEAMIIHQELRDSTLAAQLEYVKKSRNVDDHIGVLEGIIKQYS